jgi:IS605 OrfB family transposase
MPRCVRVACVAPLCCTSIYEIDRAIEVAPHRWTGRCAQRKLSGQEARFARHVNHTISKRIVREAQRTRRGIALENLKHIRTRVRARKSQRTVLHSWSFFQLQACIAYKAARVGILIALVDPLVWCRRRASRARRRRVSRPRVFTSASLSECDSVRRRGYAPVYLDLLCGA